jgi:AraC family ethanolamine operon transcriptional activator
MGDGDSVIVDRLVDAALRTVCSGAAESSRRFERTHRWHDADLVHETLDHLDTLGMESAPVLTLCRHVGVSERRLQLAFQTMLGVSPNGYMRHRALQAAHRALRDAEPSSIRVATIAAAHGFRHLGRFAGFYRSVYGESPSRTLARPPSSGAARRS